MKYSVIAIQRWYGGHYYIRDTGALFICLDFVQNHFRRTPPPAQIKITISRSPFVGSKQVYVNDIGYSLNGRYISGGMYFAMERLFAKAYGCNPSESFLRFYYQIKGLK